MKKMNFMMTAAVGALMLTACTQGEELISEAVPQPVEEEMPIGFDTYINSSSSVQTRAYSAGLFTSTNLQTDGFGVFAYQHTTPGTFSKPNFMFNQQVSYESSAWTYTPLKYWPNETTNDSKTGNDATSANTNYLSFFAYAPYKTTVSDKTSGLDLNDGKVYGATATTQVSYGITEIVGKDDTGAPTITYKVNPNVAEAEDLLWSTAPLSGLNYTAVNGAEIGVSSGLPLINLVKPDTHTKIKFLFQHALTALRMDLNLAVDQLTKGGTLAEGTTVKVNSITLAPKGATPTMGFAMEGKLTLNNTSANTPLWGPATGEDPLSKGSITIKPTPGAGEVQMNSGLTAITNSTTLPLLVYGTAAVAADPEYSIEAEPAHDALMVIPVYDSSDDFIVTVTIDYDIETSDETHYGTGGKVTVNNVISKDVTLKSFRAGRLYNLHLVLGLTSVKIDAEAQDWAVDEQTVDLPRNL